MKGGDGFLEIVSMMLRWDSPHLSPFPPLSPLPPASPATVIQILSFRISSSFCHVMQYSLPLVIVVFIPTHHHLFSKTTDRFSTLFTRGGVVNKSYSLHICPTLGARETPKGEVGGGGYGGQCSMAHGKVTRGRRMDPGAFKELRPVTQRNQPEMRLGFCRGASGHFKESVPYPDKVGRWRRL